jgi:transcriptional regulator with XRE-family HTH domain
MDKKISTLLAEIKGATGWSEAKIAEEIGTSQPTVNRILKGQDDCKGSTLRAISELHRTACGAVESHPFAAPATVTPHKLTGETA